MTTRLSFTYTYILITNVIIKVLTLSCLNTSSGSYCVDILTIGVLVDMTEGKHVQGIKSQKHRFETDSNRQP